jgi:iron complex transport system substrate-binding protein
LPYVAKDTWFNPDYEKIIELKPDIVLTLGRYNPESEDKLGPVGITVVRMEFNMADLMTGELKKLGYILDTEKEAEEFTNWYEGWMNKILDRTDELSDDKKPLVYGGYRDKVGGKGTFWEPAWRIAGGINIAGDLEGYSKVDPEWVLEQNPDVIVKAVPGIGGYGEDDLTKMKKQRDTIMSQPGWENVEAIKNKRVYLQTFLLHLGTHTVISVAYMAKWFHPDLFEDLDPKAVHQEYLDRFMGIDYNVYEHGVFVYPPLED